MQRPGGESLCGRAEERKGRLSFFGRIDTLARSSRDLADTCPAVVGGSLEQPKVIRGLDERPRVAGEHDNWKGAEDGVDGAAFQPELAQMAAAEERVGLAEQLGGGAGAHAAFRRAVPPPDFFPTLGAST